MGSFITIEGVEGAGKSTLRSGLADAARANGREVIVTREPGATTLGKALRSLLLDPDGGAITPLAELMLFAADRAQHVAELIQPALDRGAVVLCDRFTHSTLAYQGYGRGVALTELEALNELVTAGLKPDFVLLLDLDPEIGLKRARRRVEKSTAGFNVSASISKGHLSGQHDRIEQQPLEFHRRVREGFLELAKRETDRFAVLDASKKPQQIVEDALAALNNRQLLD